MACLKITMKMIRKENKNTMKLKIVASNEDTLGITPNCNNSDT